MTETVFTETEAILAALDHDDERLLEVLISMTPGERARLVNACVDVIGAADKLPKR